VAHLQGKHLRAQDAGSKGGGVQSTTLTFDTVDNFASASLDKPVYTRDSQVHITVTDLWLNI
jgi:hypothetical protein